MRYYYNSWTNGIICVAEGAVAAFDRNHDGMLDLVELVGVRSAAAWSACTVYTCFTNLTHGWRQLYDKVPLALSLPFRIQYSMREKTLGAHCSLVNVHSGHAMSVACSASRAFLLDGAFRAC